MIIMPTLKYALICSFLGAYVNYGGIPWHLFLQHFLVFLLCLACNDCAYLDIGANCSVLPGTVPEKYAVSHVPDGRFLCPGI